MSSKNRIITGAAVLLLGIGMLVYRGFYVTKEESVLKVGPIDVKARTQERVSLPAPLAWALVVGGGLIVFSGATSRKA